MGPMSDKTVEMHRCVRVCQGRACKKLGATAVLAALQAQSIPGFVVRGCSCLGQCGNGPMVVVLPEQIWYDGICPAEVPIFVEQYLCKRQPAIAKPYHKFHPS